MPIEYIAALNITSAYIQVAKDLKKAIDLLKNAI
jgi:hypothetical protein